MMRRTTVAAVAATLLWGGAVVAQVNVTWDGGDGAWNSANWTSGGTSGQLATDVFSDKSSGTDGGHNVFINGGAVTYDQNTHGDFTFRQDNGPSNLTLTNGAVLTMDEETCCEDGQWTRWDAANLVIDNATMSRTLTTGMGSLSGGAWVIGSWNADADQRINVYVKNGGRLENDGILLLGYASDMGENVRAAINIDGGHVDLTGGENFPMGDLAWDTDLVITSHDPLSPDGRNFQGYINFAGNSAGTLTVDEGGIANPFSDIGGIWQGVNTRISYQDMWDRDLLRANGMSARSGRSFDNYFEVTGEVGSADYKVTKKVAQQVVWDGGDGNWAGANWNGSQLFADITGHSNGSRGGHEIVIGGGATVTYDPNPDGNDDGISMRFDNGFSKLVVQDDAVLQMDSNFSPDFTDGWWTTLDSETLIDGGTLRRTFSGNQNSGGALIFGSWNADHGAEVKLTVTGGGVIENDGVFMLGYDNEAKPGVSVSVVIDNGSLDLTGGGNEPLGNLFWENDLVIHSHEAGALSDNGAESNFQASINFTGPGSITVDEDGITNPHLLASGIWVDITEKITYEDLWDRGLLQANGLSGLDGELFADYFMIEGEYLGENYKLTSLLVHEIMENADFNGDDFVDGADEIILQRSFGVDAGGDANGDGVTNGEDQAILDSQFGAAPPSAVANAAAVPEPSTAMLLILAVANMSLIGSCAARRRN